MELISPSYETKLAKISNTYELYAPFIFFVQQLCLLVRLFLILIGNIAVTLFALHGVIVDMRTVQFNLFK
jgi:hypothetical protein